MICDRTLHVSDGRLEVVISSLALAPNGLREAEALLSEPERERARRFAFKRDRRRFIAARARLRQLLGERLRAKPRSIELAYGAHGKPELAGAHAGAPLCFNLSHADDLAVYAFADRPVGVDVEAVRLLPDADAITQRFFSPAERQAYGALAHGERTEGFFNCWTRKEAFIKALGEGLSHPLDQFDVSLAPGQPARILRVAGRPGARGDWEMHSFVPERGFVAALVAVH